MLFKVLDKNGRSCHGGDYQWSLPQDGKPGGWTPEVEPSLCSSGWHVTTDPLQWRHKDARLFVTEVEGPPVYDGGDKGAFRRARLLYEITPEWPLLPMFPRIRVFFILVGRMEAKDADLSGANLSGAYLSGANLSGANLSCANLSDANLRNANLSGANLRCANLSGANLSDANLRGAYLSGATVCMDSRCAGYRKAPESYGWEAVDGKLRRLSGKEGA